MTFSHFSAATVLNVRSVQQQSCDSDKPSGFWVSVDGDDDWPTWCRDERQGDWAMEDTRHVVEIDLDGVLLITSEAEMDAFTEKYLAVPEPRFPWQTRGIRWGSVAEAYKGIVIAPYQYARRMKYSWYYGWDCASGCIWDASAIRSVRRAEVPQCQ